MATQITPQFANVLLAVTIEPEEIGRRIKRARKRSGWTQLEFAIKANVSPSTVQRWERGQLPTVRELMRIAPLLSLEVEELVEPDEEAGDRESQLRAIVREELAPTRAQIDRILELIEEPPQSHQAKT